MSNGINLGALGCRGCRADNRTRGTCDQHVQYCAIFEFPESPPPPPSTMVATTPYQCLTLSLLVLPPMLLTAYFMAIFPSPPAPIFIHPSLASMPPTSKSWSIYPEDFYPGGGYASFPNGKVCYPLFIANVWAYLNLGQILAVGTNERKEGVL